MGGLPCAKQIIDNGNALTQTMQCMNASILLNAPITQPTYGMRDRFIAATNEVAKIAAEIEKYVGAASTEQRSPSEYHRRQASLKPGDI